MSYSNNKISDLRDKKKEIHHDLDKMPSDCERAIIDPMFIRPPLIDEDAISKISEIFLRIVESRYSTEKT